MPANYQVHHPLSETPPRRLLISAEGWVLIAAFVALLAKVYCALTTIGTNDVTSFVLYARFIHDHGLAWTYEQVHRFNHTPLTVLFISFLYKLNHSWFPFGVRFPGILADFFSVLALLWLRKKTARIPIWALLIFALSPVSFMVSGYHGNIDPILTLFLLLAACATVANRPVLSGVLFGLACNVKIIPLLFSPIFFFFWLHRKRALAFTLTVIAVVFIGFAWPIFHVPDALFRNVFAYSSSWGLWGIAYWLREAHIAAAQTVTDIDFNPFQKVVMNGLKFLIVGTSLTLAWRRRKLDAVEMIHTIAIVWVVFFVFAPGVGAQYLVWVAPFLLVYSARWYAIVTAACTPFLFFFYDIISHGMPWHYGVSTIWISPYWVAWSNWPWVAFIACLVSIWRERGKSWADNDEHSVTNVR